MVFHPAWSKYSRTIDQGHTLIAGLHRLEAAKLLGWAEIDCTVTSLDGLQAELAEIDENFIRNDLSALEHGEMLLRRKEIYETLHPETRAGTAQALAMNTAKGNNVSDKMTLTTKSFLESEQQKEAAGYEAEQAGLADSIQELTAALSEKKDKTANISSASRI